MISFQLSLVELSSDFCVPSSASCSSSTGCGKRTRGPTRSTSPSGRRPSTHTPSRQIVNSTRRSWAVEDANHHSTPPSNLSLLDGCGVIQRSSNSRSWPSCLSTLAFRVSTRSGHSLLRPLVLMSDNFAFKFV